MPYSNKSSRRLGCVLSIALPIGAMALGLAWLAGGPYTSSLPRPFNSESWIAGGELEDDRRCGMLADLKLRFGIEDKTRSEIVALLGEPDDRRYEPDISYWLLCPSFLDIWVLGVRWEDDRAVETIVHDT